MNHDQNTFFYESLPKRDIAKLHSYAIILGVRVWQSRS